MQPFCAFIAMVALGLAGGQAFAQEAVSARGHFADLNRARIYYEDHGSGEPLLLLHNFGSTASQWKTYIDDWAPRYRVIAWDMRGHGRSTNPSSSDVFLHAEAARDLFRRHDSSLRRYDGTRAFRGTRSRRRSDLLQRGRAQMGCHAWPLGEGS